MKKITLLISGLVLSTIVSTTSAQQLHNNDFEGGWVDCNPWTSNGTKTVGKTPTSWTISNVAGYKMGSNWMGTTQVGDATSGYNNSSSAVKIYNIANSYKPDQIVPGYVTTGTTWSTADTGGNNADGGTFGGIEFNYKPDAVSFQYTRSHDSENPTEQATVVAYLWKGTYSQEKVPGNIGGIISLKKVTMTDRDRNILGMSTAQGGAVSKTTDAARLAKINYALKGDAKDWTNQVIDFTYEAGAVKQTPDKFNIIFAAGDYWSTSPGKGNTLCVDDVKLLYYSRLESVLLGGYNVPLTDGVYDYVAYVGNPTSCNATVLGGAPTKSVTKSNDPANNIYSITVTNNTAGDNATDIDGKKSHTYNFKYMSQTTGHIGVMNLPEGTFKFGPKKILVDYIQEADGTYALSFGDPDGEFEIDGGFILDRTLIKGVTMTVDSDGCYVFTKDGATQGSDYTVSLVNDGATKCIYDPADGRWIFNFDVNYDGNVTRVTVTSDKTLSGVNGMNSIKERVVARSGAIEVSGFDGVAEVYTIDGRLVAKTAVAGNAQIAASNGIYLVRTPNTVKKVIVR